MIAALSLVSACIGIEAPSDAHGPANTDTVVTVQSPEGERIDGVSSRPQNDPSAAHATNDAATRTTIATVPAPSGANDTPSSDAGRERTALQPDQLAFDDWPLEPYAQRAGDKDRGRQLLVDNGTAETPYISCGVPEAVVKLAGLDRGWETALKIPDRRDKDLPYESNYLVRSGIKLVTTNCLICHASKLGGQLVIGLPEVNRDFTQPDPLSGSSGGALRLAARTLLDSATQSELARVLRIADASAQFPRPTTIGINPADSLFGMLAMHRDPVTLAWRDAPDPMAGPIPKRIIFTDVPALWNTHRRPHLFATGFAHGDLARVMMTASLLCLEDRDEARKIDAFFPDIQAYINSLRAPKFEALSGRRINSQTAARGKLYYANLCRRCHGDKEGEGSAPRTFVPLAEVGTDPVYAQVTARDNDLPEGQTINYFFSFFNRSWYGTEGNAGKLVRPSMPGYVPPPLDGIWATAPYFHNGSVPTLDGVLDPALRPRIFRRSFNPDEYDFDHAGYPYEERTAKRADPAVYDTTELGNSNQGHTFAASLSDGERAELLEYLKTF